MAEIEIITSAHWDGDARLQRHVQYFEAAGRAGSITSYASRRRPLAVACAIGRIARTRASHVVLVDPELFAFGAIVARLTGAKPVIDIHEDYRKVVTGRDWVRPILRGPVSALAGLLIAVGRFFAAAVVVAAPELRKTGDTLVMNIPRPEDAPTVRQITKQQVVYVGDVTRQRGFAEMIQLAAALPQGIRMVIVGRLGSDLGRVSEDTIDLTGRLSHDRAWEMAAGSLAGLSLLQDLPAYREAVGTKIWEYMAAAIPPVVSDLPGQRRVVEQIHPDLVCGTIDEAVAIIARLASDDALRSELGSRARQVHLEAWNDNRPDLRLQELIVP